MAEYRVLMPLDGSSLAEHSLAFLPTLQQLGDVQLHLLGVVDEAEDNHDLASIEAREHARHEMVSYLGDVLKDVEQRIGISGESEVKAGLPAEIILARESTMHADLTVISTHGRSGIQRWRRGSVADKVIRGVSSPVLVVGPKALEEGSWYEQTPGSFKEILVPLDGSALAEQALPTVQSIAQRCASRVHLVRVISMAAMGYGSDALVLDQLEEGAQAYLDEVGRGLTPPGGLVTETRVGSAALALEEYIVSSGIDLVVMTSHGRTGLIRAALGSITDRLLGNGAAPVLVVGLSDASV